MISTLLIIAGKNTILYNHCRKEPWDKCYLYTHFFLINKCKWSINRLFNCSKIIYPVNKWSKFNLNVLTPESTCSHCQSHCRRMKRTVSHQAVNPTGKVIMVISRVKTLRRPKPCRFLWKNNFQVRAIIKPALGVMGIEFLWLWAIRADDNSIQTRGQALEPWPH